MWPPCLASYSSGPGVARVDEVSPWQAPGGLPLRPAGGRARAAAPTRQEQRGLTRELQRPAPVGGLECKAPAASGPGRAPAGPSWAAGLLSEEELKSMQPGLGSLGLCKALCHGCAHGTLREVGSRLSCSPEAALPQVSLTLGAGTPSLSLTTLPSEQPQAALHVEGVLGTASGERRLRKGPGGQSLPGSPVTSGWLWRPGGQPGRDLSRGLAQVLFHTTGRSDRLKDCSEASWSAAW